MSAQNDYKKKVLEFRRQKDQFFKSHPQSPLTPEQKAKFKGLPYFPINEKFRVKAQLKKDETHRIEFIQTNTGETREYVVVGRLHFSIDDQPCELTLYQSIDRSHYFLPFKDATNGKETYGAGRYLEVERLNENEFLLDFNYAYNPYCAYNENWVCPLVPFENHLPCRIEAGEKKFH